jgi:hypothetical protein
MPDEVILDVTTIEENVTVETTAGDVVEIQVVAPTGNAATVTVGTTTTGSAGTNASVTNSGTTSAAVFNFTIPRGNTGATGAAGPNSVTSATTSDYTAELDLAQVNTGVLVVTDGVTIETLDYNFGTGSAQALKDALEIASADISDASTVPVYNETTELYEEVAALYDGEGAINAVNFYSQGAFQSFDGDNYASFIVSDTPISWLFGTKQFSIKEPLGNGGQCTIPDASGTFALTSAANGEPDKLTAGTISGATTFNTTSYTYGTGAAAAHRTALGLTTLATTTPAANVATFLATPSSANLASALTDENGTGGGFVRAEGATLTSPSIAGTAAFTGTTRPTSAGNGTPAATSLITSNDAYYRNIVNPLKQGEIPLIPLSQFYAESALAGYTLNSTLQSNLSVYADPSTAQNSWYRYILSSSIFNQINNQWSYTRGSELFFLISNVVTSKAGTRHQIAITNTAPEGTIDTASRFGLAIEVFFVSGVLNARLLRKLTAASSLETSSSVAFSGTFGALWLRTNADGSVELRVLSSSNFTTLPLRPESASVTLPSGTYTNSTGSLYMTGLATSATIVDNGCYFQVHKAQYHIDS